MNIKQLEAKIMNNYYIILILAYILNVFSNFRPAVFMLMVNILIVALDVMSNGFRIKKSPIVFFLTWCIISFFFAIGSNNSLSTTIMSLIYVASPIVCFFAAGNELVDCKKFYIGFLFAIVFNDLFGTICFYLKPSFFVNFIARTSESSYAQLMHHAGLGRLVTIFGSIETGTFSAFAIFVCLGFFMYQQGKQKWIVLSMITAIVSLLLTQQRGPLFSVVLVFIFIIFYSFGERLLKPWIIALFIITFIIVMYVLAIYKPTIFIWMIERITNPSDAITERYDYQWETLVNSLNVLQWITGKGIGAFGFFVENNTRVGRIFDELYFNMIGELGLVGFCTYIFSILGSFTRFIRSVKKYFVPFMIIAELAFVGLGTTLTYYPQIMPIFWFSMGVIYFSRNIFEDTR